MSLTSWFFILSKGWMAWRVRRSAPVVRRFWDAPTLPDGVAVVRDLRGTIAPATYPAP